MTFLVMMGHSHLLRLRSALELRALPARSDAPDGLRVLFHNVWEQRPDYADSAPGGGVVFNAAILEAVKALTGNAPEVAYVTLFGGNGHVVFGLTRHPRPFDFVVPDLADLPLDPAAEVLPYGYVAAAMQGQVAPYLWQMIALRQAAGAATVLCLESPPPYADDDYVRLHLGSYIPDPANIVSAGLRLKLWRTHSRKVADHCEAHGIAFLPVPSETLDAPGFMTRAGYGPDATHANAWFGERVLQQLEARFGQPIVSFAVFS